MDQTTLRRVKLVYPPALIDEPLLYRLIQRFGLLVNIRRAHVEATEAWLVVDLEGPPDRVEEGLAWIQKQGVLVEPVEPL
ncbi:MAG: NIL domain-containing protein [Thermoflexus sp.]|jgi:ABC-type methionine transport system ATPase subunit|uniref:NIL domain-containing protein n=1 Tax=Thermoflexus TaxID=1495649 RepID=UPI001C73EA40|nr:MULTISPECIES: NIL domain-containing protein [Thermoflexus]MDT7884636.1 NIL domain-containing protein [Thermoflexus sp.]QWK10647.1 MAG: NIL domain-containing protein [Thermoflexus hugenholtzii]